MADYTPGEMDIQTQQKTFGSFVKSILYSTVILMALMAFLWMFRT